MASTSCKRSRRATCWRAASAGEPPETLPRALARRALRPGALRHPGRRPGRPLRARPVRRLRAPLLAGHRTRRADPARSWRATSACARPRPVAGEPRARLRALARHAGRRRRRHQRAAGCRQAALSAAPKSSSSGPRKNYELFAADPRIRHAPVDYRRGSLRERLAVAARTEAARSPRRTRSSSIPIRASPNSACCRSARKSATTSSKAAPTAARATAALPELAAAWAAETFGVARREAVRCARQHAPAPAADAIAVSLGVGENPAKRLPDPFEEELLAPARRDRPAALHRSRAPAAKKPSAWSAPSQRSGVARHVLGRLLRRLRRHHRRQPPVRGLRFRRPARGRGLRRPADQHLRRLPRAAHVRTLASRRHHAT